MQRQRIQEKGYFEMVIFDEKDMEWAMSVFNVGKVVYPVPVEEDTNTGDDAVDTE